MKPLEIVTACDDAMRKRIKTYPCHTNRASAIGDLCERKLVYMRTHWEFRRPHDVGLQYIFSAGNLWETPTVRLLQDAGFEISRIEEPFVYRSKGKMLCTGHVDGVIDGEAVLEIKTMNPYIWEQTDIAADFYKHFWSAKYPAQLNLYCFGLEIPHGVWVLVNKTSGRIKQVDWELDYDLAEQTLLRCERINAAIENETLPKYLEGDPDYCENCEFFHICCPSIIRESLEIVVDELLIADVAKMQSIQTTAKEYASLKKSLKAKLEKSETTNAIIGNWKYNGTKRNWNDRWEKMEDAK